MFEIEEFGRLRVVIGANRLIPDVSFFFLQKFGYGIGGSLCEIQPSHGKSAYLLANEENKAFAVCQECYNIAEEEQFMSQTWVERWEVSGTSGKIYTVAKKTDGSFGCSCPAWKFQRSGGAPRKDCQHILQKKMDLIQEQQANSPDMGYSSNIDYQFGQETIRERVTPPEPETTSKPVQRSFRLK